MLPFYNKEFFTNRKFVLLDDTVYRGTGIRKLYETLEKFGIEEKNIKTATLVVHHDSSYEPDYPTPKIRLRDAEYIAWKEVLGSLVASDIRPTERDHPLYFFSLENLNLGDFIEILKKYGEIHSVGNSNSKIIKFTLTVDSSILKNDLRIKGLDLGSIFKVRFYWSQISGITKFTAVPMGFPVIDMEKFIQSGSNQILATHLGLRPNFFEELTSILPEYIENVQFYYASRGLSALFFEKLFNEISSEFNNSKSKIKLLEPNQVDGPVQYLFPDEYIEFYNTLFKRIKVVLKGDSCDKKKYSNSAWKKIECFNIVQQEDPLIPDIFSLLKFVVKENDSAIWDGKKWKPNEIEFGITFSKLLAEINNIPFISKALDELLESGLLRAKDLSLENAPHCFTRVFLPGGEYNAVAVSRITDVLNYKPLFTIDPKFVEEEINDLWGPY